MSRYPAQAYTAGVGDPVPRHRRNPRRGYDVAGRETVPATIANSRANGAAGIRAECIYGHEAKLPLDRFPDESFVPGAGLRLRCSRCGTRGPRTVPAWSRVSDAP